MKLNISNIGKQALRATAIAAATVAALLLLSWKLNTDWLEAEKLIAEHIQFSDLFFRWHMHNDAPPYDNRTVVVLDISQFKERKEQVELMNALADAEPFMVALDVIYPPLAVADTATDHRLIEAIRRLPNLILAVEARENDTLRSFFADSIQAQEALCNLPTSIIRTWEMTSGTMPTVAVAIAQKMGITLPEKESEWLIDYSICDNEIISLSSLPANLAMLKNQIVIVGDLKDLRDTRVVPTTFRGNMRTYGVLVHKQIIQTMMTPKWFRTVPVVWNWIMAFIILWLFLFSGYFISTNVKVSEYAKKALVYLTKMFILLLLIFFAYLLFWGAHCYINIWWIILAPATLWMGELVFDFCKLVLWGIQQAKTLLPKKRGNIK